MSANPKILIVDDEAGIRESLSSILRDERYSVEAVESAELALERLTSGAVEVVLLDVWLPGMDGMEALSRIQSLPQPPSVIIISGHGTIETAVRATKLGAFDFIEKPLSLERIIVLVRNAIQQRRLQGENQLLHTELGHRYRIVGDSVEKLIFFLEAALLDGVADENDYAFEGERLFDEIEGAKFGGADGGFDGAVAGDDDDARRLRGALEAAEGFHAVHAGEPDVERNDVDGGGVEAFE